MAFATDIKLMGLHDKINYIVNVEHRIGFTSLTDIIIHKHSNFHIF